MKASHLFLLLALNCGWAAVPTLAKRLEGQLGPVEFVLFRYGFGFVALAACWPWLTGRMPRGRDFWRTCLMGVAVFHLGHWCQIAGIQRSQASDSSILLALDPLVSTLGAALFLRERVPARRWLGFAFAILGVVVMSLWHRSAPLPGLLANLLIVLSFVAESVWSVMGKPLIERWGIPKVTALALGAGSVANLIAWMATRSATSQPFVPNLDATAWTCLALLGIVFTAFGYSVWYVVIRETPISIAALTIYLQPLLGTGLACLLTDEKLHAGHALGAGAILGGLALGLASRPHAPSPPNSPNSPKLPAESATP
jgi:drug/metabolite transporter (DMT)-like permease